MDEDIEFPPDVPEEQREYLRRIYTKNRLMNEAGRHQVFGFFSELTQEQLRLFSFMMDGAAGNPNVAGYYEGIARAMLQARFNICMACGKNHEAQMEGVDMDEALKEIVGDPEDIAGKMDEVFVDSSKAREVIIIDDVEVHLCPSCRNDRVINLGCPHHPGSHGQDRNPCPEPFLVPCPDCRTPQWYVDAGNDELPVSPCHTETKLLPTEEPGVLVCAECRRSHAL